MGLPAPISVGHWAMFHMKQMGLFMPVSVGRSGDVSCETLGRLRQWLAFGLGVAK
ncbi:MAG: hypothetical protein OXFUSZZB_000125 [Candidatus Fervidibacter sp.]|jgi:hypothetical protein